jgi:hypothetical protein
MRRFSVSALLRAAGPLALTAALTVTALGQPESAPPRHVKVTLVVILASEKGDKVEPLLKRIAEQVRKRDPQLKSFRVGSMTRKSLAVNETATFPVMKGESAQVVIRQSADGSNHVELAVTPPCQGEIVYRTVCGKFLPIVTRCRNDKHERLILAIRVQPCHGK